MSRGFFHIFYGQMHIFIFALGVLALVGTASGKCNECMKGDFVACINATAYKMCTITPEKEVTVDMIGSCAPGLVCTNHTDICRPKDDPSSVQDCPDKCRFCDGRFACVSSTEYTMCSSDGKPGTFKMKCPPKQYCNIDSYNKGNGPLCTDSCSTEPSCSSDVIEKTDPKETYVALCEGKPAGAYSNQNDPTCKTYLFCQTLDNDVFAVVYNCPTSRMYFDKKDCVEKKPIFCSS